MTSRIEEAMRRLQASSGGAGGGIPRYLTRHTATHHEYLGLAIETDIAAFQRHGFLPSSDAEMHRLAEEYRSIKRRLLPAADPARAALPLGNLVMVGSAVANEGKTFACANLALSIAREKDWSIVLVDADIKKRELTEFFSAEGELGVLDLIKEQELDFESVVMPTSMPGISFLPAGGRDQDASELLASERMRDLCLEISRRDSHRIVLFDSSPVLLTSEASVLATQVGQIVLIVRANSTPQQAVLAALAQLDHRKPMACVLNNVTAVLGAIDSYGQYGQYEYGNHALEAPLGGAGREGTFEERVRETRE